MNDQKKSKAMLIEELIELRRENNLLKKIDTDHQTLLHEAENRTNRLSALSKLADELNHTLSETEAFKQVAQWTPAIVANSDRASVALLDEDGRSLQVLALDGVQGAIPTGTHFPVEYTMLGEVIKTKATSYCITSAVHGLARCRETLSDGYAFDYGCAID